MTKTKDANPIAPRHKRRKRELRASEAFYGLRPAVVDAITEAVHEEKPRRVRRLIYPLHYSDVADLLERLRPDVRRKVIEYTERTLDPEVLTDLDEALREEIVDQLDTKRLAAAVADLDTDDAVEIIEELDAGVQREILGEVDAEERALIEESLAYPEDSAGRLMQRDAVILPQRWTVGQTIDFMRESEDLPDDFYDLFVVDADQVPVGAIPVNVLLRTRRPVRISQIMSPDITVVPVTMDQEEVAQIFRDRDLVSAPVVDADGKVVGMITIDDIVDVIDEEAEEDMLRLAKVGDAGLFEPLLATARNRIQWLVIALINAVLASFVISWFEHAIDKLVALAVLMPIVAAMAGNAGMQVVTVTVRALAIRELAPGNIGRVIAKEVMVGLLNGVAFASVMCVIAALWFDSWALGAVLAAATLFSMAWSGLRRDADPFDVEPFSDRSGGRGRALSDGDDGCPGFLAVPRLGRGVLAVTLPVDPAALPG